MTASVALIQNVGRIQFGFGAVALLQTELDGLGARRPLLLTDSGVRSAGLLDRVMQQLADGAGLPIYDACPAVPSEAAVRAATEVFRESGCDAIVAVGGGAVMDLAKGLAILARSEAPLVEFAAPNPRRQVAADGPPIVAIPTTAGTGSEVGRGAGIEVAGAQPGDKSVFFSVHIVPKVALYDPDLTLTSPRHITAGAGADALSHCIEGFLSRSINPPVEASALDGALRLATHLPRVMDAPDDRDARWQVMMGALQGGLSMWKGLGFAHALSMPLDAFGLHHGTVVGMLLPSAVRFARPACPNKVDALDRALGGDAAGHLERLNRQLGITAACAAVTVPESLFESLAMSAEASVFNSSAPRRAAVNDFVQALKACF